MSSAGDGTETIHTAFQEECRGLELLFEKLRDAPANERPAITDSCLTGIGRVTDLLKDASSYLPAYDQRTYSLKVKNLSDQLAKIRQSLTPKQKFVFKKRSGAATTTAAAASPATTTTTTTTAIGGAVDIGSAAPPGRLDSAAAAGSEQENLVIASRKACHIRPTASATAGAASPSLLLSSLEDCVVALAADSARFSSAAVKNVEGSVLLLGGAVNGPIHLTSVSNSVLVFSCRQFRMHDTRNVDVYLHCTSRPIIEDCDGIRFHPYGEGEGNMWDQVDDFKWLRSEKSPHWSASRCAEETDDTWKELAGKGVGEIEPKQVLQDLLLHSSSSSSN